MEVDDEATKSPRVCVERKKHNYLSARMLRNGLIGGGGKKNFDGLTFQEHKRQEGNAAV